MLDALPEDAATDTRRSESNSIQGSGPATNFRQAATTGVTTWGPIMGGVVAIGGTIAIVGSSLHQSAPH